MLDEATKARVACHYDWIITRGRDDGGNLSLLLADTLNICSPVRLLRPT